jgi:hypothetical protein
MSSVPGLFHQKSTNFDETVAVAHLAEEAKEWKACDQTPSTVQYSTVQYSTVQYSTVQYSTVQYIKRFVDTNAHEELHASHSYHRV